MNFFLQEDKTLINPKADPDRLFTTDDAAEYFSVSRRTIQDWIRDGHLTAFRPGGRYLIRGSEIIRRVETSKWRTVQDILR